MSEKHPYVVNLYDKRVLRTALRDKLISAEEFRAHEKSLKDAAGDAEPVTINQHEEIEKRAQRRKRMQQNKRYLRARQMAMIDEFIPTVPTPKTHIMDE